MPALGSPSGPAPPPIAAGARGEWMHIGCRSAAIGMFAARWRGLAEEAVVADDHITGVVPGCEAGHVLGRKPTCIRMRGRRSAPRCRLHVASPDTGWGGPGRAP